MWWKNVLACLPVIETVGSRSVDAPELQVTLGLSVDLAVLLIPLEREQQVPLDI